MRELAHHPQTINAVQKYLAAPGQVLAIVGQPESGKLGLAYHIAAALLEEDEARILESSNLLRVTKEDSRQEISIDGVRKLISSLRMKALGDKVIKRIALIEDAHLLSREAQNALLKILEQPNPDTVFILTLKSAGSVLPTVMSRANKLIVHPVTLEEALKHYGSSHPEAAIKSAWSISEGAAGLLDKLLFDSEGSTIKDSINRAKEFAGQDKYNRLLGVDSLSKSREEAVDFLESLAKVIRAAHHSQVKRNDATAASRLLIARKQVMAAQKAVAANASVKLTLLNLVVSLKI
ncbi:MAG: dnaX [Candidatus Saccharibacteria bacterium]|nr:dnaX [Candidatus Saccharibacteria bacterium]